MLSDLNCYFARQTPLYQTKNRHRTNFCHDFVASTGTVISSAEALAVIVEGFCASKLAPVTAGRDCIRILLTVPVGPTGLCLGRTLSSVKLRVFERLLNVS